MNMALTPLVPIMVTVTCSLKGSTYTTMKPQVSRLNIWINELEMHICNN